MDRLVARSRGQILPTVQVLRGLAAVLVLLFHATFVGESLFGSAFLGGVFDFGGAGVDFFFVLSGFVILYVHYTDIAQPSMFRSYIMKRLVRVCPMYWLVTATIIIGMTLVPELQRGEDLSLVRILTSVLFIPQAVKPILGVGWTLIHEMFFYLLFGLLIFLPSILVLPVIGVWIALIIGRIIAYPDMNPGVLVGFITNQHNLEFVIGACVGLLVMKRPLHSAHWFLWAGAALFIMSGVLHALLDLLFNRALQYGGAAALMVYGAAVSDLGSRWSPSRFFVFLGEASYSVYLVHLAVLTVVLMVAKRLHLDAHIGAGVTITVAGLTALAVGCAVYFYVETPFQKFLRRFVPQGRRDHLNAAAVKAA